MFAEPLAPTQLHLVLPNISSYRKAGTSIVQRGNTVELNSGDFLLVDQIDSEHTTGKVTALHGHILRRVTQLEERSLGTRTNEVCFLHEQILEHHGSVHEQSRHKVPWGRFLRIRHLIRTNKPWQPLFHSADIRYGNYFSFLLFH